MKKLFLILISFAFIAVSFGQTVKSQNSALTKRLDVSDNVTYWYKTGDVLTQADTLRNYYLGIDNNHDSLKQYARIKIVENSGTADLAVKVQGKVMKDEAWTDLLSTSYSGTGSDTTIVLDGTTAKNFRFYNILLDGNGAGTFNVTVKSEIKFYK